VAPAVTADSVEYLLVDFPAVVNNSKMLPRRPSGDVEHHILTKGLPVSILWRIKSGNKLI
jgi:hypothetical protein